MPLLLARGSATHILKHTFLVGIDVVACQKTAKTGVKKDDKERQAINQLRSGNQGRSGGGCQIGNCNQRSSRTKEDRGRNKNGVRSGGGGVHTQGGGGDDWTQVRRMIRLQTDSGWEDGKDADITHGGLLDLLWPETLGASPSPDPRPLQLMCDHAKYANWETQTRQFDFGKNWVLFLDCLAAV